MACMRHSFRAGVVLDGRYRSEEYIHAGSFGMVFKAEDMVTGKHVAIKCLTKRSVVDDADVEFAIDDSEELVFHQILGSHRNIVNLVTSFETDSHLYLVMEYCERGDLYEAIYHNTGPVETEKVRRIMLQLIDAVEYIHSKGVYHRDIKPENIFLLSDMTVKLGDFGLSTSEEVSYENMVGSDRYMAPEQCESDGAGYSPEKADVWAVGIVLLNLLFSKNPFTKPSSEDPFFRDFCNSRETLSEIFFDIGNDTYDVLEHCLNLNPAKRSLPRARDALLRVQSFTTSCEDEDDFLTGSPRAQATANREPLGTPAIQSPMMEQAGWDGNPFWTEAVQSTPPQPIINPRKLSMVQESGSYSEDLFSKSAQSDWCSSNTVQSRSLASAVDSGGEFAGPSSAVVLALPERKRNKAAADKAAAASSLPIGLTRPKPVPSLAMVFGRKNDGPRSWSDMFEEDEEEARSEAEQRFNAFQENNARTFSRESTGENTTSKVEGHGGVDATRHETSIIDADSVADDASDKEDASYGFFMYEPTSPKGEPAQATENQWPRYSPPSKRPPTAMDRWAALGERRRAYADVPHESRPKRRSPITSVTSTSNSASGTKEFSTRRNFGLGNGNAATPAAQGGHHSTSYQSNCYNFSRNREARPGQSRDACPWTRRNDYGASHREGGRGDCRDVNWRRDRRQPFGNFWWVGGCVEARS